MKQIVFLGVLLCSSVPVYAAEWSGSMGLEYRVFQHNAGFTQQHDNNASVFAEPEFYHAWDGGNQNFVFKPFLRLDQNDDERSHADIRELSWLTVFDAAELRVGIRKVFWGVTESQHLVDVINQTDLVESADGEDKLGQPMINLALIRNWGTVDLFVLPYFRERTFPGIDGRLRSNPYVDTDNPVYESADEQQHVDYAIRYTHSLEEWDLGLSFFDGTNRDPAFTAAVDDQGNPVLRPVYNQMQQVAIDVQGTFNAWLWKLEWVKRQQSSDNYDAATAGFEYSFYGVFGSQADLGLVMEYLYDDRGTNASIPFADDLMVGLRLALNDEQSSEALFGVIDDLKSSSRLYSLEASRRFGDEWKLNLEARFFTGIKNSDPMFSMRNDDFIQLEAVYYF